MMRVPCIFCAWQIILLLSVPIESFSPTPSQRMTIHDHPDVRLRLATDTPSAPTKDEGEQQHQQERHTPPVPCTFDFDSTPPKKNGNRKHILLIRHGLSYMNEYIGSNGITFGGPNFTDIFNVDDRELYYRDSPLSDIGREQAARLGSTIIEQLQSSSQQQQQENKMLTECNDPPPEEYRLTTKDILQELELIVVSPQ